MKNLVKSIPKSINQSVWYNEMKYMEQDIRFVKMILETKNEASKTPKLLKKIKLFERYIFIIEDKLNLFMKEVEKIKKEESIIGSYFKNDSNLTNVCRNLEIDFQENKYIILNYLDRDLTKNKA